jgi:hypothetical protein
MARQRVIAGLALMVAVLVPAWSSCIASAELSAAKVCRKAFTTQGRTYSAKRLGIVLGCVDKLLRCELLAELAGADPTACRLAVTEYCAKRIGAQPGSALDKLRLRFDAKVGVACQTPVFDYADVLSTGPGGLWFANDAACASSIDLPSFMVCLRDEIDARADALATNLKPRAGLLFDNVGLGAAFPHLVRPPAVDALVSATAPGSGVLVDPGTIVVAAGSALRMTGDDATLPCSGGTNGRLTVTVGSATIAQTLTLEEPYGAGAAALFGPWVAAATIPYTIELTDGSCQHTLSGVVSVP